MILGLLRVVYNYHIDGESRGSLWNPDNYLIQYENYGEKVKQVLLAHDWLHDRGNEKQRKRMISRTCQNSYSREFLM